MPAFRTKGFVCPQCKKLISYSSDQEGKMITCPRCDAKVMLTPDRNAEQPLSNTDDSLPKPAPFSAPRRHTNTCLFWALGGCLSVLIAISALILLTLHSLPLWVRESVQQLYKPLVSRSQLSSSTSLTATLKNNDISITVAEMKRECPRIYQATLRQSSLAETPAYCVTLVISNNGKTTLHYRTWRQLTSESDIKQAAKLQDSAGRLYGQVSFGAQTWPTGAQQSEEIPPGESLTDIILFELGPDVPGDFLLTLPGENVGTHGRLGFRIPATLIHGPSQYSNPGSF